MVSVSNEEVSGAWKQVRSIKSALVAPTTPTPPILQSKQSIKAKLQAIQAYLNALEYNYTGTLYFDTNKNRSFKSIVGTAKAMINDALPIQCLEAVFLASYLTASLAKVDRFPVSFTSTTGEKSKHRHIVLVIRYLENQTANWGALGLSRSDQLMYKEATFSSLSSLLEDFKISFENVFHQLCKISIGLPLSHDIHSAERVQWRMLNVHLDKTNWKQVARQIDLFARDAVNLVGYKKAQGSFPESFSCKYTLHVPDQVQMTSRKSSPTSKECSPGPSEQELKQRESNIEAYESVDDMPIAITPREIVFNNAKKAEELSTSEVFLVNKTSHPYFVQVDTNSPQLCIVNHQDPMDPASTCTSCIRIAPNGMTVIAIRLQATPIDAIPSPSVCTGSGRRISHCASPRLNAISFQCIKSRTSQSDIPADLTHSSTSEATTQYLYYTIVSVA